MLALLFVIAGCSDGPKLPTPPPAVLPPPAVRSDAGVDVDRRRVRLPATDASSSRLVGQRLLVAEANRTHGILPRGWTVELAAEGEEALPVPRWPSSENEARRAVEFVARHTPQRSTIRFCTVHTPDPYGTGALQGVERAAERLELSNVAAYPVTHNQGDYTELLAGIDRNRCSHVVLAVAPEILAPWLIAAGKRGTRPVWIGTSRAWSDSFFDRKFIKKANFSHYYQMSSLPFWEEPVPRARRFRRSFKAYGSGDPDAEVLAGYVHALALVNAARVAIDAKDITAAGYARALDESGSPFGNNARVRVLKPDFRNKTWTEFEGWARPGHDPVASRYEQP